VIVGRLMGLIQCVQFMGREGKGKVHPRTRHEGPEGSRDIALLFL
jgi:hypothetical protein